MEREKQLGSGATRSAFIRRKLPTAAERELSASLSDTKASELGSKFKSLSTEKRSGVCDDFVIFTRGFGDQVAAASLQHPRAPVFLITSTRQAGAPGFEGKPHP